MNSSLLTEHESSENPISFQEEIYRIQNSNDLSTAGQCTIDKKLNLYVPYDAVKFFWSGFGVPDSAKVATEIAQHIAEKEGKQAVTLEHILALEENLHIKACKWNRPITLECQQFWHNLSCEYATATLGEVRVILGSKLNPESVWLKTEQGQLEYRRRNGHDLWGFTQYELETIYCNDMVSHDSQIPEIKNQICIKN